MAALAVNIDDQSQHHDEMNFSDIIDRFFQSKKNSNCILELEDLILSNDENTVLSAIYVVKDLFVQILEKKMLSVISDDSEDDVHEKYRLWLLNRYQDFTDHLLVYLQHVNVEIQNAAFCALMAFVKADGENPMPKRHADNTYFPQILFEKIITELSSHTIDHHRLIEKLQEYSCYNDIKIFALKAILKSFEKGGQVSFLFLENCFQIMCIMQYPRKFFKVEDSSFRFSIYASHKAAPLPFYMKENYFKKLFSSVWYRFLKYELPVSLYRKVLIVLHKSIMPHVSNPCLLTDFLTESYNKGGVASLLALNSLFFLIEKCNIEYPDFFQKLYALFTEDIINSKYSGRFFTLSNLFLSSTHLSASIVAAFVKRLSRLALTSNPSTILVIISFISNLLRRHPMLKPLINRPAVEVSSDPYDVDEVDPAKSNAINSSLWEIKTMQNHVNPDISRKAKIIDRDLTKVESNMTSSLNLTTYILYQNERKRKFTEVAIAVEKQPPDVLWLL